MHAGAHPPPHPPACLPRLPAPPACLPRRPALLSSTAALPVLCLCSPLKVGPLEERRHIVGDGPAGCVGGVDVCLQAGRAGAQRGGPSGAAPACVGVCWPGAAAGLLGTRRVWAYGCVSRMGSAAAPRRRPLSTHHVDQVLKRPVKPGTLHLQGGTYNERQRACAQLVLKLPAEVGW